jgi:glycerol-3-phosphate dehydrogenase (NAD(P)+)
VTRPVRTLLMLGAGAWGTALAISMARAGTRVLLWGRNREQLVELAATRENRRYLPGIPLPGAIEVIPDLALLPAAVDTAVLATPLQTTRESVGRLASSGVRRFVCTAKGIESGSRLLVHEIVASTGIRPDDIAIVSGPSFAREVAEGRPTALTVAATDTAFGDDLCASLHSAVLRPYATTDVTGVAVGGAVKNVLAIAAGIADGLALGANSRAALITRGLAEMARFGVALGGRHETFMGLAGLGDLVLTCTDDQSRNRRFGKALGQGTSVGDALAAIGLVEGIPTAEAVMARAAQVGVELPICAQVARTLSGACSAAEAVSALMMRDLRPEGRGLV